MDAARVEAWTLQQVDRVKRNQHIEDDRVEVKADFVPSYRAARRIAGNANAAGGNPILWIIGLDEERGVVELKRDADVADWMAQVRAYFDGIGPALAHDLVVETEEGPVRALVFETTRAPYVVTTGDQECGPVQREVPYRSATSLRSATHADLIRILEPLRRLPEVEVLSGSLSFRPRSSEDEGPPWEGRLKLGLYIEPSPGEFLTIPFHRSHAQFKVERYTTGVAGWVEMKPPVIPRPFLPTFFRKESMGETKPKEKVDSLTVRATRSEVLLEGPGRVELESSFFAPEPPDDPPEQGQVTVSFRPSHTPSEVTFDVGFRLEDADEEHLYFVPDFVATKT